MAYKKPESLDGLSIEDLRKLNDEALAAGRAIIAKGDDLSDEELAAAETLMGDSAEYEAEIDKLEQAETARADRLAKLRDGFADSNEDSDNDDDTDESEKDDEGDGDADGDGDSDDEDADAEAHKEVVVASGQTRTVSRARKRAPKPPAPKDDSQDEEKPRFAIVASANVPGVVANETLPTMLDTAKAFEARSRGFVAGSRGDKPQVKNIEVSTAGGEKVIAGREFMLSDRHQRFGVAQVRRVEQEFVLNERMSQQDQYDTIMAAAKRARIGRDVNAIIAAGGWCAPSEIIYGFLELEEVTGLLDLPTVTARRGGIQFTKGPDYGTLAATWGFLQTEAQAEAGTAKTCYELECPDWTEIRLDAVGFCVTAPVLTNSAYPELTNRVLQIGTAAHAHKVNASVISRISTYLGAAVNWAEVGGTTSDILDAAALQAVRLRYQYAMAENTVIEAVFPIWLKEVIRADLGRRLNQDNALNVPDAAIQAFFAVRGIRPQWVYDYQPIATGNTSAFTAFPSTVEFMMYPAGSFTKLTKDVIDLDTIYDSVGLSENVYTAAFYEEGIAVANTGASGVKVAVALNTRGAVGFPAVGAGSGITFAAA